MTPSRVELRGVHLLLASCPLRCRSRRIERELESLADLEEESSPCPSIPVRDKTKGIGRMAWKKRECSEEHGAQLHLLGDRGGPGG